MADTRIGILVRTLAAMQSRRGLMERVAASLPALGLMADDWHVAGAKHKHKHKHKHKKHKGKGKGKGNGGGGVSCPAACTATSCGSFPSACPLLPADNIWHARVDGLPLDGNSAAYIGSLGAGTGLHADFGAGSYQGETLGIPFAVVSSGQPGVSVSFDYAGESDGGPYPIPGDVPIEGGGCGTGDRHILLVDADTCTLYELFDASRQGSGWRAGSGAVFDLRSNALRPAGWTSADAAGLPILPGLVRYEEVAAGVINHALRFTADVTRTDYVWPARHQAGASGSASVPPLGQRFRLQAGFNIAGFSPANQVILTALKTYGMFLADNGSNWFLSGAPDDRWNNDDLRQLQDGVHGSDFEAVDCSSLMADPNSGRIAPPI
jgi:hypothetical protein